MQKNKSIIIIGAGIAGLSAGCYGQMNGFDTQIFELHSLPGGLCTAWKRNGFTFDGCIHWLVGSRPGSSLNLIWRELGAVQGRQIYDPEVFVQVRDHSGKTLNIYTDIDRFVRHLLEISPEDAPLIREFGNTVRCIARFSAVMPTPGQIPPLKNLPKLAVSALPALAAMSKYGKISVHDFAGRFRNSFLRRAFATLFDMPDFPMTGMLMTLAWMQDKDAGYPIGGSLAFAQAIEQRYLGLGGQIHYNQRVQKIIVENDQAVGIILVDGSEVHGDYVISAADGHATLFDMLEEKYLDDKFRSYYQDMPIFDPIVQVSLGIDGVLADQPDACGFLLDKPVDIAGRERKMLSFRNFRFDPTLTPPGKSAISVVMDADYGYWKALADDEERYESEKKQTAISVINVLDSQIPGLASHVEVVDVATPLTYERYTGNWRGSMEGWLITTHNFGLVMKGGMQKSLPGLRNFYMAGQWVEPGGGVPSGAMSARTVLGMICKQEKQPFRTIQA